MFLLPIALALLLGLLFPLVLIADLVVPGAPARLLSQVWAVPDALAGPYLATLAVPIFALSILAVLFVACRRGCGTAVASPRPSRPCSTRARASGASATCSGRPPAGAALDASTSSEAELGRRYVTLLTENFGQPGFRELILRTADLETGRVLPFVVLQDAHRKPFLAAQSREGGARPRAAGSRRADGAGEPAGIRPLFFDAAATRPARLGAGPVRRVSFPRGGLHAGETHRLTEATLLGGCGISEAVAAGAEQMLVVSATPEASPLPARRRGADARVNGVLAALERAAVSRELHETERLNRVVETLGHRTSDGGRAWQDPATGRLYRDLALYVIRPGRRALLPLDLDGARDPATEVVETTGDLLQRGYEDAYRLFVEPVVGGVPPPPRSAGEEREEGHPWSSEAPAPPSSMFGLSNDDLMTLGLAGLGVYFLVLLARGLCGYERFRRVRPTAILTWPVPRPSNYGFLLGLGVTGLVLPR